MSHAKMTTLLFLLLLLSPFVIFDSDFFFLCIDFVSNLEVEYPWNIFMIYGRNVE